MLKKVSIAGGLPIYIAPTDAVYFAFGRPATRS
jgi:hypothetical protein